MEVGAWYGRWIKVSPVPEDKHQSPGAQRDPANPDRSCKSLTALSTSTFFPHLCSFRKKNGFCFFSCTNLGLGFLPLSVVLPLSWTLGFPFWLMSPSIFFLLLYFYFFVPGWNSGAPNYLDASPAPYFIVFGDRVLLNSLEPLLAEACYEALILLFQSPQPLKLQPCIHTPYTFFFNFAS